MFEEKGNLDPIVKISYSTWWKRKKGDVTASATCYSHKGLCLFMGYIYSINECVDFMIMLLFTNQQEIYSIWELYLSQRGNFYIAGNIRENCTKSTVQFLHLKPLFMPAFRQAIVHLEKDKPDCDGWVSIKLAMWTDGFDKCGGSRQDLPRCLLFPKWDICVQMYCLLGCHQ